MQATFVVPIDPGQDRRATSSTVNRHPGDTWGNSRAQRSSVGARRKPFNDSDACDLRGAHPDDNLEKAASVVSLFESVVERGASGLGPWRW